MSEIIRPESALYVSSEWLPAIEHGLSFDGPGVVRLQGVLNEGFRRDLVEEIADDNRVHWRDAGGTYTNNRGIEIIQNHDVFALKLSLGDPAPIAEVPRMRQLAAEAEQFVQSLGEQYNSLSGWDADEMSYHRYYDQNVGLSFHRDNLRFPGLIVVISIDGEADFQVIERDPITDDSGAIIDWHWRSTYTIPTKPGDMVLTRAPGLLPDMTPDDRPEHAVVNGRVLPRISFMLRANNRPNDQGYGFEYYNWP